MIKQNIISYTVSITPVMAALVEATALPVLLNLNSSIDQPAHTNNPPGKLTGTRPHRGQCNFTTVATNTSCNASITHNHPSEFELAPLTTSSEMTYDSMGCCLKVTIRFMLEIVVLGAAAWLTAM
jgi:hypothetical protein